MIPDNKQNSAQQSLVSIIVPIYNVENYINKCVDSILTQTYHNLEIILVDDGSPDGCPFICDEYGKKDERIVVVHKKNGGLSDARNAGLDVAQGDYITFIDGDDWYAEDAIEILVNTIEDNECSVACMKNVSVNTDYTITDEIKTSKSVECIKSTDLIKKICKKDYSTSVCNKLFSKILWNDRRFKKDRLNEDFLCLCDLLMEIDEVTLIEYTGYFYYSRVNSLTRRDGIKIKAVNDAILNSLELKRKAMDSLSSIAPYFARIALYQVRTLIIIMPAEDICEGSKTIQTVSICLSDCSGFIWKSNLKITDKLILYFASKNLLKTTQIVHKIYGLLC